MILDHLDRADLYRGLSPGIATALDYLQSTDFSSVADGRYPLGESGVVALVSRYRTKSPADAVWESHRRNIDVQYVAMGSERFGYVPIDRAPPVKTAYSDEKDVMFYEPGADTLQLSAGQFAIFFPHDIHAPSLADGAAGEVLKVVMKVPVE
jgi:YhcH/YjgK/YiaL family protein